MLIVFPFCEKDAPQALKCAEWMRELGPQKAHQCLVATDAGSYPQIIEALETVFSKVDVLVPRNVPTDPWPVPTNHVFTAVVQEVEWNRGGTPFLWWEPDAIARNSEFLNRIDSEFKGCGKPFMGDLVRVQGVPEHMSGIAVYSRMTQFAFHFAHLDKLAFDVALAPQILPWMHRTTQIQHEWKPEPFKTESDLNRLRPEAVVYHQDKTGSLIDLMREMKKPVFERFKANTVFGDATLSNVKEWVADVNERFADKLSPTPIEKQPMTIAGEIRMHVTALSELIDGKTGRKALVQNALRMAKIIGAAKKRK